MILELKHGSLNLPLNVCNYAYKLAVSRLIDSTGDINGLEKNLMKGSLFVNYYIYESYVANQINIRKPIEIGILEFFEQIEDESDKTGSNYIEVFEAVSNTIISTVQKTVEEVKKKIEKEEKFKQKLKEKTK